MNICNVQRSINEYKYDNSSNQLKGLCNEQRHKSLGRVSWSLINLFWRLTFEKNRIRKFYFWEIPRRNYIKINVQRRLPERNQIRIWDISNKDNSLDELLIVQKDEWSWAKTYDSSRRSYDIGNNSNNWCGHNNSFTWFRSLSCSYLSIC